jgi:hypothetical protein
MPLWHPVIGEVLHPVLVIRDPVEVAVSLARRDGTPIPFGLAAWEIHLTTVLAQVRGHTVTVAPYRQLMQTPETPQAIVESVAAHLSERFAERIDASLAGTAVDQSLYRNHAGPRHHEQQLTLFQHELWRLLESLLPGDQTIAVPSEMLCSTPQAWVSARHEHERVQAVATLYAQQQRVAECATERNNIDQRLLSARKRCEALARQLDTKEAKMASLSADWSCERARRERVEAASQRADEALAVILASRSWRMTAPLRALARRLRESPIVAAVRRRRRVALVGEPDRG